MSAMDATSVSHKECFTHIFNQSQCNSMSCYQQSPWASAWCCWMKDQYLLGTQVISHIYSEAWGNLDNLVLMWCLIREGQTKAERHREREQTGNREPRKEEEDIKDMSRGLHQHPRGCFPSLTLLRQMALVFNHDVHVWKCVRTRAS